MADTWQFDVAIVGGGPGGAAAAAALQRRGHATVVLERTTFPRFHIGESQLPWMHGPLAAIGAADAVAAAGFVPKWGANFANADGSISRHADFTNAVEVAQPQTYQVARDKFDQVLLEHALACGADIRQDCRAERAEFDADGVTLTYVDAAGATVPLRVGAVIDASGRAGFLARQFGERRTDPALQSIALHRQYEGVPRFEGRRAGDIRLVLREDGGWFWFIPIDDAATSVGMVMPREVYHAAARPTPAETLDAMVAATPLAHDLLAGARPATPARFEADYSYLHSCQAGDRFVLVGDAGAFLDPIFSTGVLMALQSGIEAAEALSDGLRTGDLSARRFRAFERRVVRRYHHFRRFAVTFYTPAFREVFLNPQSRFGIFEAVLSVLAGNWRPSLGTRLRVQAFFLIVAGVRLARRRSAGAIVERRVDNGAPGL